MNSEVPTSYNPARWEVGEGWYPLIKELIEDLKKLGWNGNILQVKEKFGGLRFYIGYGDDAIFDRITKAEAKSLTICEECGEPGKHRGKGWFYVSCDRHVREKN